MAYAENFILVNCMITNMFGYINLIVELIILAFSQWKSPMSPNQCIMKSY